MTMKARLVVVSVVVWTIFVAIALPSFSVRDTIVAVVTPVVGIVAGGLKGFSLAFGIAMQAISGPVVLPVLSGAMFGAVAGILSGWLGRAYFGKRENISRSFISSLFSPEILEGNPAGFFCYLIVSTAIGVALSVILSSVGMFDHTTQIGASWQVVLGGGPGDYPFGDSLIGLLFALFYMLGALLIACGIAGLCVGGILGALIGAGLSSIGVPAFIGGASEGLAFRFFEPFRPEDERSGRLIYFLAGAGAGAAEGVLVGFGTGAVLFVVQLAHIFG
jgi:hypothetical protein